MKKKVLIPVMLIILLGGSAAYYKTKDRDLKRPIVSYQFKNGADSAYMEDMANVGLINFESALSFKYDKERVFYKSNFGLNFMGDEEMKRFLSDNDFIMGAAEKYKGDIPVIEGKKIISNYKLLNGKEEVYIFKLIHDRVEYKLSREDLNMVPQEGQILSWQDYWLEDKKEAMQLLVKQSAMEENDMIITPFYTLEKQKQISNGIMIIGPSKYFDVSGMTLIDRILSVPPPKDPIAVLKVKNGYVELANWE